MTIPTELRLAFDLYGVGVKVNPLRRRIWALIEPSLAAPLDEHFRAAIANAPSSREVLIVNAVPYMDSIIKGTERLFTRSFDDGWVEYATKRVETEVALGIDMRSRPAVANVILCTLNRVLSSTWLGRRNAARLMDEAIRVVFLDVVVAVSIHYTIRARNAKERGSKLEHAIKGFSSRLEEVRGAASDAITSLSESAGELHVLANAASERSRTAAVAADDTAVNIGIMAAAADGLATSISNIHEQATRSSEMAHGAAAQSERTNATIQSLADAVGKIGSVAKLISDIAAQTNLLALNAAIEAARAGEAGLGFAVVAAEVKSLATQTSKATKDIGYQIGVIEAATRRSVEEIKNGGETVTGIAGIARVVAEAVNEQAAATGSIAEGASRAAANAMTVAEALRAIDDTVSRTQKTAQMSIASTEGMKTGIARIGEAVDEAMEELSSTAAKSTRIYSLHRLGKELDQKAG